MPEPTTLSYLVVAALLFVMGTVGVMVRRNPLIMFMTNNKAATTR